MDISLIVGWLAADILIVMGITVPKLGNFWDVPSVQIVVGGTIAGLIACYPFSMTTSVPKHISVCLRGPKTYDIAKTVDKLVELATVARQSGLLALEEKAGEIMYLKGSALAPAFGMIGTLVGLINMLKAMDLSGSGGASSLGQDMGVALITTFYGSSLSNVIFHPIAQKLAVRDSEEVLYDCTIIEGVLAIQAGDNPRNIREHLLSSLPQKQAKKLLAKAEGGSKPD